MASVHVVSPGLQTTVQDLGRWGYQAEGVSVAGAMDPFAHRLANALAGNARSAATLEITLIGPELHFDAARWVAIAGAAFDVQVDGEPIAPETPVRVPAGSTLRFGARTSGARAYLAIEGGVDVAMLLGSRATHVQGGMGGWQGRALRRGDSLPLGELRGTFTPPRRSAGRRLAPDSKTPPTLRVLPGPQDDRFASDALDVLTSALYRVGGESNRMGYRLTGPSIAHRDTADIVSDATPLGALQVPGSGQPVLLMADRQTTGGYAKLATVISADIPVAAQLAPGDLVAFRLCSHADAFAALVARERALLAIEPGDA